ncbi:hypothetical protein L2E82_28647 [Cichorium intybus]|uniref:Uncharacterized protein n=1 Tax=Cichorium intybus TaxID=13427 RepID=A0ACB9CWI6_CICIN|nr:hypothetical protein L2E82_28647 [Cichorium intybus]
MLALVGSHAVNPEVYWKSVLPNSPMPKAIKDLLYTAERAEAKNTKARAVIGSSVSFTYLSSADQLMYDPNEVLFFIENDLHQGTEMNLHFMKADQKETFLPQQVADSIPFSSNKLLQIYNKFSIKSNSLKAKDVKQTLSECESKGNEGEEKYCATSLESMIDFSTDQLGKKVKAISTDVDTKGSTPLQKYTIEGVKKFVADKAVVCHKQNYVYAVFYCHKTVGVRAYAVSLVGVDGTKAKAVAICHTDTAKWNPKHLAFQVLKVKPGSVPVCHFLPEDNVVWVPY